MTTFNNNAANNNTAQQNSTAQQVLPAPKSNAFIPTWDVLSGLDIGNGYVKGAISTSTDNRDRVDLPSSERIITRPNDLPEEDKDAFSVVTSGAQQPSVVSDDLDFFNQVDTSFYSPLIKNHYRHVFGKRSLVGDGPFHEFNVNGNLSKAEQELSKTLVLSIIAAKAAKVQIIHDRGITANAVITDTADHGTQTETEVLHIKVAARTALALPIDEYMQHRHVYADDFTENKHQVVINNFVTPIVVDIEFIDVQVLAEGASAQYAINSKGEQFMESMLADLRSRGGDVAAAIEGITAADILASKNTIGIDLGEGTVNFPVFTSGKFNPDTSTTSTKGYGSVMEQALKSLKSANINTGFVHRKQLADYLTTEPSATKRRFRARIDQTVNQEKEFFAEEVAAQFGEVLSRVGAVTDVAYVYGGGATAMKDALYPRLLEKVAEMNGLDAFPVLYLDSMYSRHLNREGLYIAAETVKRLSE